MKAIAPQRPIQLIMVLIMAVAVWFVASRADPKRPRRLASNSATDVTLASAISAKSPSTKERTGRHQREESRKATHQTAAPLAEKASNPPTNPVGHHSQDAEHLVLRGLALPWREAELGASVSNVIAEVHVREGARVARDQLLVTFDGRASAQELKVAIAVERKAAAAVAQSELDAQLSNYKERQLHAAFRAGAVTQAEYQEAKIRWQQTDAAVLAAKCALDEAQARRELAEINDTKLTLHAPFDGVVMRIDAVPGEIITGPVQLILLADLSQLRTELQMPAADFRHLKPGTPWTLKAGAPIGSMLPATLIAIEPRVNPVTQTVRAVFEIANPNGMPAGFSVQP